MTTLTFGKFKNLTIENVFNENTSYCNWLYRQPMAEQYPEIYKFLESKFKNKNDYYMTFGRYKNKPLSWILENDNKYILYLKGNEYVKNNLTDLYKIVNNLNV
jgi:hypothetical protein